MNIDIGSKIKTLRLSKSMTQEQLAKALHVSAQAVSKWENGVFTNSSAEADLSI